jgi:hypothetical protein
LGASTTSDAENGDILYTTASGGVFDAGSQFRLRWVQSLNGIIMADFLNASSLQSFYITTPSTTFTGGSGVTQPAAFIGKRLWVGENASEVRRLNTGENPPTTGNWARGDYTRNSLPVIGSPKGWICTVSGAPGTWVSEGNL